MAVIKNDKFIGVVAVDNLLKDYFNYSDVLSPNEMSYIFAVNDKGDLLFSINAQSIQ